MVWFSRALAVAALAVAAALLGVLLTTARTPKPGDVSAIRMPAGAATTHEAARTSSGEAGGDPGREDRQARRSDSRPPATAPAPEPREAEPPPPAAQLEDDDDDDDGDGDDGDGDDDDDGDDD